MLAGEPGLGKSRQVAEAPHHVPADQWLWLESRGIPFGRSFSYWPLIEILKRCFTIEEDDTEDQSWSSACERCSRRARQRWCPTSQQCSRYGCPRSTGTREVPRQPGAGPSKKE